MDGEWVHSKFLGSESGVWVSGNESASPCGLCAHVYVSLCEINVQHLPPPLSYDLFFSVMHLILPPKLNILMITQLLATTAFNCHTNAESR